MLHVAVLAQVFRVHGLVWAAEGRLGATLLVVTVFAHAPGVVLAIDMLTIGNDFFLAKRRA